MMPVDAGIAVMTSRYANFTSAMALARVHMIKVTWVKERTLEHLYTSFFL